MKISFFINCHEIYGLYISDTDDVRAVIHAAQLELAVPEARDPRSDGRGDARTMGVHLPPAGLGLPGVPPKIRRELRLSGKRHRQGVRRVFRGHRQSQEHNIREGGLHPLFLGRLVDPRGYLLYLREQRLSVHPRLSQGHLRHLLFQGDAAAPLAQGGVLRVLPLRRTRVLGQQLVQELRGGQEGSQLWTECH